MDACATEERLNEVEILDFLFWRERKMKPRATAKNGILSRSSSARHRKPKTQKIIPATGIMTEWLLVFVLPTSKRKPANDAIPATKVKLLS